MMTPKQIYSKTMPFVWAKLALAAATAAISVLLLAILIGIGLLLKNSGVIFMMLAIWVILTNVFRFVLMHYMGYLVKVGHIAVITESVKTGIIPENQVAYGKNLAKTKFGTSNVFFGIDKLIGGAVKQLQNAFEKLGNKLEFIPGMNAITNIIKLFIGIALGYIDECCLGWIFYNKDTQGSFKSATDGVVIYAQNWKTLLKNAAKTTGIVVALMVLIFVVAFIPLILIANLFPIHGFISFFIAFILAFIIAWAIKAAFIDSYMMISIMVPYMQVAPNTTITFDLYDKLCKLSGKFRSLFNKAKDETPLIASPVVNNTYAMNQSYAPVEPQREFTFCGSCGAKNTVGTKFCGSCGNPLN
ncbi:MAG: zinc ribbon domain-containing protein [Clostridium sp.]|jgi:hypothetical protein|nr:zinc ribbon domain-containing protein [Clostridium sp.]